MQSDFQDLVQDVDKLNIDRTTLAPSEMMPPVSEEQGAQGHQVVGRDDTITRKISLLSATTMKKKDEEAFMKQEEGTKGATSGNFPALRMQPTINKTYTNKPLL